MHVSTDEYRGLQVHLSDDVLVRGYGAVIVTVSDLTD